VRDAGRSATAPPPADGRDRYARGVPGLTARHYYDFGDDAGVVGESLLQADEWDALRTQSDGVFSLPKTRAELERRALGLDAWVERAGSIDALLRGEGVESVASYGAGTGMIEFLLLRLDSRRRMVLTEFAPATVEKLRELLPEVEVVHHDLLADAPLDATLHLFHRLDGSLSNSQWRSVFRSFRDQRILFVGHPVLPRDVWRQKRQRRGTFAGWIRTRGAYESLWRRTHRDRHHALNDSQAWWLEPR
jgi:hypothetical protein